VIAVDRELCARCGGQFKTSQVCDGCRGDAGILREAAAVLRRWGRGRPNLVTAVFIGTLEKVAARAERAGQR
jgi:hypothetical protein